MDTLIQIKKLLKISLSLDRNSANHLQSLKKMIKLSLYKLLETMEPPFIEMPAGNLRRMALIIADLLNLPYERVLDVLQTDTVIDHNVVVTNTEPLTEQIIGEISRNVPMSRIQWIEWLQNHIYYRLTGYVIDLLYHLPEFDCFSNAEVAQWAANFAYVVAYRMRVDGYLRVSNGFTSVGFDLVFQADGHDLQVAPGSEADFPDPGEDDWFDHLDDEMSNSSVRICGCPESCVCGFVRPVDWRREWRVWRVRANGNSYC